MTREVAASAVAVGWSGYFVGLLHNSLGMEIPAALASGPYAGGIINLPAERQEPGVIHHNSNGAKVTIGVPKKWPDGYFVPGL